MTPRARSAARPVPATAPARPDIRSGADGAQSGPWRLCRVTANGETVWCYARWADALQPWEVRLETGVVVAVDGVMGHHVLGLVELTLAELRALAARGAR